MGKYTIKKQWFYILNKMQETYNDYIFLILLHTFITVIRIIAKLA